MYTDVPIHINAHMDLYTYIHKYYTHNSSVYTCVIR